MSEQQLDCIDKLILCFQQKNLFITNILNITKQLEIKTENEEVDFEDLLDKRGEFMSRIDKCSALEKATVNSLEGAERETISVVLKNGECVYENERLSHLNKLISSYHDSLKVLVVADKTAIDKLKVRYALMRDKVNELRSNKSTNVNMYTH